MNKEFIPYEQALELKELGFNKDCYSYYFIYEDKLRQDFANVEFDYRNKNEFVEPVNNYDSLEEYATAPLYQQAFRWFREKYNLFHNVKPINGEFEWAAGRYWGWVDTYEDAQLNCIKQLIKTIKEVNEDKVGEYFAKNADIKIEIAKNK